MKATRTCWTVWDLVHYDMMDAAVGEWGEWVDLIS